MSERFPTKPTIEQGFDACVEALTDFGYKGVTVPMIRLAHERWMRGEEPGDVIEAFAFDDFNKYPQIFGIKNG